MADVLTVVLRYAHILSAILWIGALAFSVMFLRSAMGRVPLPARKETMRQLIPAVIVFVPISAVLTIGFGAALYLVMGNFEATILWGTTWGLVLLVALVLALALFAFGMGVVIPASRKILGHLNEEACSHGQEMGRLQRRFNNGQVVAMVWGFVILSLMIVATEAL